MRWLTASEPPLSTVIAAFWGARKRNQTECGTSNASGSPSSVVASANEPEYSTPTFTRCAALKKSLGGAVVVVARSANLSAKLLATLTQYVAPAAASNSTRGSQMSSDPSSWRLPSPEPVDTLSTRFLSVSRLGCE